MKSAIFTEKAPQAIGTYSQAIKHSNTIYISGQIPLNPTTMNLSGTDIDSQVDQVFKNLDAITTAAGGSLNHIVKLTIYLTNLAQFQKINLHMEKLFEQPYPARAVIEVAALPKNALIEVDAIMATPSEK